MNVTNIILSDSRELIGKYSPRNVAPKLLLYLIPLISGQNRKIYKVLICHYFMHEEINDYVNDLEEAMLYIGEFYLQLSGLEIEIMPDFDFLESQSKLDEELLNYQLEVIDSEDMQEAIDTIKGPELCLYLVIKIKSDQFPSETIIRDFDAVSHYTGASYEKVAANAMDALLEHVNPSFMEEFHTAEREFFKTVNPRYETNHSAGEEKKITDTYHFVRTTILYLAGMGYAEYVEELGRDLLRTIREAQEEQEVARNLNPDDINPELALGMLNRIEMSRMAAEQIYDKISPFESLPLLSRMDLESALEYISKFNN